MVTGHCPGRVPPFGHPWINAYLRLPMAFRSLSRPSSAISALASTLRSFSLDLASFRSRPLLRLFRDRAARTSFIAFPCAVFKVRSPSASNLPPIDPLTGQSSGPLKTSGLSPRFRDSSKRYRNLPKRSERSILRLLPPLILVRVSSSRLFAASCRPFARASALASPAAGLFRLLLPHSRSAFRLRPLRSTWDSLGFGFPSRASIFWLSPLGFRLLTSSLPLLPQPSPLSLERR